MRDLVIAKILEFNLPGYHNVYSLQQLTQKTNQELLDYLLDLTERVILG